MENGSEEANGKDLAHVDINIKSESLDAVLPSQKRKERRKPEGPLKNENLYFGTL